MVFPTPTMSVAVSEVVVTAAAAYAAGAATGAGTKANQSPGGVTSEGVAAGRALLDAIDVNLDSDHEQEEQQEQGEVDELEQMGMAASTGHDTAVGTFNQAQRTQNSPSRPLHDSTWSPPSERYMEPTFTSLQMEQDIYIKQHTQQMIAEEERDRQRHHQDLLDPQLAFRREHQRERVDSLGSITSDISDWTTELQDTGAKKKVKKKKTTKKLVKKKSK